MCCGRLGRRNLSLPQYTTLIVTHSQTLTVPAQVFSGTTWTQLPQAFVEPILTNDAQGMYRQDNHAWLFGWSNGTVFQVGTLRACIGLERWPERVIAFSDKHEGARQPGSTTYVFEPSFGL